MSSCPGVDRYHHSALCAAGPMELYLPSLLASHLAFEPSCYSHKSVDPFFVLPKDLTTWLTRRHLLVVSSFIIHAASGNYHLVMWFLGVVELCSFIEQTFVGRLPLAGYRAWLQGH